MKKIFRAALVALLFCLALSGPLLAAEDESFAATHGRVVDGDNLLTDAEESALRARLDTIVAAYQCDVVVVTAVSLGRKSPRAYADDFFDNNGYGIGPNFDGVLLLVCLEERDWYISTTGFGIRAFTDWGVDNIGEAITPALGRGGYYEAFSIFASRAEAFLAQARSGAPYDVHNKYLTPEDRLAAQQKDIIWALGIGLVVAFIVIMILKGQLKTVRRQILARDYMRPGSFHMTGGTEKFLYKNVVRIKNPEKFKGGTTRGSFHSGSSGTSHGGGGGKF